MALIYQIVNDSGEIETIDREAVAIDRLKFAWTVAQAQGKTALYGAFSGGKDSEVVAKLLELSGVPYTLNYNNTGIDPPELIYFMRENYPKLKWNYTEKTMWRLISEKGIPPSRQIRYCCEYLKEHGGENEFCVTGVRAAESKGRSNKKAFQKHGKRKPILFNDNGEGRKQFEHCQLKGKYIINPIIDWSDADVWEFIEKYKMPYCKLYDEGFSRLGCIGCPLASNRLRKKEFKRYPRFKALYIKAFDKMLENNQRERAEGAWTTGEQVFNWWISDGKNKPLTNQIKIEEDTDHANEP